MNIVNSRTIPIIRNIGYIIGFSLLIYQGYRGVLAIIQGNVVLPGLGISLLALFLSIMAMACQITAWWIMMHGLRANHIPLKETFWGYTVSFLPRYIPGTIWGYMSRGNWLKTDYDINYKTSTFGSMAELGLMVIVNIILSAQIFLRDVDTKVIFIIILAALIIFIILISFHLVREFIQDLIKNVNLIYILAAIFFLFFTWFFYGFSLYVIAEPINTQHLFDYSKLFLYVSIYSAAWLIGFLVLIVPAGMGIRELALSNLLTTFALLDVQASNGLAIFFRLVVTVSEFSWLILGLIIKKLSSSIGVISKTKQL